MGLAIVLNALRGSMAAMHESQQRRQEWKAEKQEQPHTKLKERTAKLQ